jgi:transposase InsO family protein
MVRGASVIRASTPRGFVASPFGQDLSSTIPPAHRQLQFREQVRRPVHRGEPAPPRAVRDVSPEKHEQQKSFRAVQRRRVFDRWFFHRRILLGRFFYGWAFTWRLFVGARRIVLRDLQLASAHAARAIISAWRRDYNGQRPHSALGYRTPAEFAAQHPQRGAVQPPTKEIS